MSARDVSSRDKASIAPQWPRRAIRTADDLEKLAREKPRREILALEPEVEFIRKDEAFLGEVMRLSKELNLPVELAGSTLSHPFYQLEESGISVVLKDENKRARVLHRQSFDKLVRDKIPTRIKQRGEVVVQASLPRSELRRALVAKLFEEALELIEAREPGEVREELADLLEVIVSLALATGVDWSDVEETARKKRDDRGGFERGAILVETSWPSPNRVRSIPGRHSASPQLVRVESGISRASATFAALVNQGSRGITLSVGRSRITVRLDRDSIEIRADGSEPSSRDLETMGQMALPLPNRSRRAK
jgi:predicted house-cleaning noncanonical NTP pyrophosphatase (MazG superfamily)